MLHHSLGMPTQGAVERARSTSATHTRTTAWSDEFAQEAVDIGLAFSVKLAPTCRVRRASRTWSAQIFPNY